MIDKREKPADKDNVGRKELFQILKKQNTMFQALAQRSTSGGFPMSIVGNTQLTLVV